MDHLINNGTSNNGSHVKKSETGQIKGLKIKKCPSIIINSFSSFAKRVSGDFILMHEGINGITFIHKQYHSG